MNAWFNTPERIGALRAAARMWVGTPFVPHAAVCGAGVDCVNLCAEIYKAAGFIDQVQLPRYVMDGGKHNAVSQLTTWLDARPDFRLIPIHLEVATRLLPGDLLCFTTGRSAHHTGLILEGLQFVHCLYAREVMVGTLRDRSFCRRLTAVYRPVEP